MKIRFIQITLIAISVALSCLAMQVFHELGRVTKAHLTAMEISRVNLNPLSLDGKVVIPSPPLIVVRAGLVFGSLIPFWPSLFYHKF